MELTPTKLNHSFLAFPLSCLDVGCEDWESVGGSLVQIENSIFNAKVLYTDPEPLRGTSLSPFLTLGHLEPLGSALQV